MPVVLYLLVVIGAVITSAAGVAALAVVLAVGAAVLVFRNELRPLWEKASELLSDTWRTEP